MYFTFTNFQLMPETLESDGELSSTALVIQVKIIQFYGIK